MRSNKHRSWLVLVGLTFAVALADTDQAMAQAPAGKKFAGAPEGRRLRLVPLPTYCPDHNRIERVWLDLHANVTRNHKCSAMPVLMRNVRAYLRKRSRQLQKRYALAT